jgi:hypothetical protein
MSYIISYQAQVLCDTILNKQMKENRKEFHIDWQSVSALLKKKGAVMSPTNCHILWKYLAYGIVITKNGESDIEHELGLGSVDEVDIESDEVSQSISHLIILLLNPALLSLLISIWMDHSCWPCHSVFLCL